MAEKPSQRIRTLVSDKLAAKPEQVTRAWRLRIAAAADATFSMDDLCDLLLDELEEINDALDKAQGKDDDDDGT